MHSEVCRGEMTCLGCLKRTRERERDGERGAGTVQNLNDF